MKIKILLSLLILNVVSIIRISSQSLLLPNYALKSHETLEIKKIETTTKVVVFYMSVENRIAGGSFCADRNIFIIYPDGTRSKMNSSNGIPVCPDTYNFKAPGEKLDFSLTFPPLKSDIQSLDLVEDCNENCFSFYGIILNNDLNIKINDAFVLAENNEDSKALDSFIRIASETEKKGDVIEALLFINIIKLAKETGNSAKAAEWYKKLKSSGLKKLSQYIKFLNDQGIIY